MNLLLQPECEEDQQRVDDVYECGLGQHPGNTRMSCYVQAGEVHAAREAGRCTFHIVLHCSPSDEDGQQDLVQHAMCTVELLLEVCICTSATGGLGTASWQTGPRMVLLHVAGMSGIQYASRPNPLTVPLYP